MLSKVLFHFGFPQTKPPSNLSEEQSTIRKPGVRPNSRLKGRQSHRLGYLPDRPASCLRISIVSYCGRSSFSAFLGCSNYRSVSPTARLPTWALLCPGELYSTVGPPALNHGAGCVPGRHPALAHSPWPGIGRYFVTLGMPSAFAASCTFWSPWREKLFWVSLYGVSKVNNGALLIPCMLWNLPRFLQHMFDSCIPEACHNCNGFR